MLYRHVSSKLWSTNIGSFNPSLSKGPTTTTWVWTLHSTPHDFAIAETYPYSSSKSIDLSRKVFASGISHISIVTLWISGMLFHGSYFSNYMEWLRNPILIKPSAQIVWSCLGQDIINSDLGGYSQGLYISSGLFHMWRSQGLVSLYHLKAASLVSLIASLAFLALAFGVMHLWPIKASSKILTYKTASIITGLGSISWSAHLIHISAPINRLLEDGVDPTFISYPHALLSREVMRSIFPEFGMYNHFTILSIGQEDYSSNLISNLINGSTGASGSIPIYVIAAHHLFLGVAIVMSALVVRTLPRTSSTLIEAVSTSVFSWHFSISLSLLLVSSLSFIFAHNVYSAPVYPFLLSDYATLTSLYSHHMWIGGFFIVGCFAHASMYLILDISPDRIPGILLKVISHRDIILGHLIWVVIFLGMHSFGVYIHNDSLQALGRLEDTFSDSSIQLKPIFSSLAGFGLFPSDSPETFKSIGSKLYSSSQTLGTSDFMIQHIHAFTIHTTALVLLKGVLYSRSSRLVSDKHGLGYRYPCDGPGRGGTCQISSWDHVFLSLFWMYNSLSILIFHFYWKMQSDVWGSLASDSTSLKVTHLTSGDFGSNSNSVNGWLRSFLWSQSSQVIQTYSTSLSAYGLVFLGSHLLWAFSLMFLFSGRGYWQELIESLLWAHSKLRVTPSIQPRALSISQGRAVGVSHYILGGIGCTWSFFISRMVSFH